MGLETYHAKRDFSRTPEPRGEVSETNRRRFVVQEHHASKLHFDFRLEMGGVLKSWSVPRGPSLDPSEKRLAVETEDHPVEYLKFEGHIPEGEYGAGTLIRMNGREGQWLLMKRTDEFAERGWALKLREPVDGKDTIEGKAKGKPQKAEGKSVDAGVRKFDAGRAAKGARVVPVGRALKSKELEGDLNVRVAGEDVPLTHLERVYWPDEGYTKGDLVRYYQKIARYILPYLE